MNIVFESAPDGATHFLRYASGYIVWCKIDEGQNNQLILSEWDSGNEYWVPGIFPVEHYQKIGLTSIDDLPTQNDVGPDAVAPKGATHRYQHGGETSWYRETEDNFFVWRDGSWYASTKKSAKDLAKVCPFGAVTVLTQEVQLANDSEDYLTWLAQNVHEWPDDKKFICYSMDDGCAIFHEHNKNCATWYSKAQWLARRAELQNKPSWKDAPEWAEWLCQRDDGMWFWCVEEPRASENEWETRREARAAYPSGDQIPEYVLGDWRDTLERRPVDLSEQAVTARLTEAAENVLAAAPALMDEKFSFDRGDWFERGELPPIGTVCLYVVSDRLSAEVEITAHAKFGLCFVEVGKCGENYVSKTAELYRFRPILTERDLAIDEMKQHCPYHGSWDAVGRIYAEALYDAGYRKEAK